MFLQAVPPPIPPPPPPGLPLENEIILLILGMIYGIIVLCKRELKTKAKMRNVLDEKTNDFRAIEILHSNTKANHSSKLICR